MPKNPVEVFLGRFVPIILIGIAVAAVSLQIFNDVNFGHPWLVVSFAAGFVLLTTYRFLVTERDRETREKAQAVRIEKAESKAEAEPEKAKFAWDVARVKLEAYFDRNLSQVNQIFWVALVVMFIGFGFILWAVFLSIGQPKITPTSLVASSAGIISQFIGATFMLIYRSTISQANSFMSVLERINTVGMSIQVLDSISEGELKDKTRAQMIDQLLNANVQFTPTAAKIKKKAAGAEE